MPCYETEAEYEAEMRAAAALRAKADACRATGQPCRCAGTTHDEDKLSRGLYRRDPATGMLHSPARHVLLDGCRWCGAGRYGHGAGYGPTRHEYAKPTDAQVQSRAKAGLVRSFDPTDRLPKERQTDCHCDPGDEDAEPCDADGCLIDFYREVGFPG